MCKHSGETAFYIGFYYYFATMSTRIMVFRILSFLNPLGLQKRVVDFLNVGKGVLVHIILLKYGAGAIPYYVIWTIWRE